MNTWIVSDTHFSHPNIIDFCSRPYNHEELMSRGMARIPESDVLIHLGDICMYQHTLTHAAFISPLKCKKILIRGNHDQQSISWYYKHGWDAVMDSMMLDIYGMSILFTHKPSIHADTFDLNIHGHFHNINRRNDPEFSGIELNKHYLVAMEHMNYQPITLKSVVKRV